MDSNSPATVKRLFVLHWHPLEQYPPTMNLLNYFGGLSDFKVAVCTSHNDRGLAEFTNPSVQFSRIRFPDRRLSRFRRLLAWIQFPLLALWKMMRFRPDIVLYIEPHSSFPAILFRLLNDKHRLFIHYHEYYEPRHFGAPGMRIIAIYHWFERMFLYRRADWISHTNAHRVQMFCDDHSHVNPLRMHVLPNLPPASWRKNSELTRIQRPHDTLKLLYVGAMSLNDTFVEELVEWLQLQQDGKFSLDVYSTNCDRAAQEFLNRSAGPNLRFHGEGIPYDRLPDVLQDFDVGLILYKANTTNYVHNETNKLFEYLAFGLEVWYPRQMLGIKPHGRTEVAPRVIEMDFEQLGAMPVSQFRVPTGMRLDPFNLRCEDVLIELKHAIMAVAVLSKDVS